MDGADVCRESVCFQFPSIITAPCIHIVARTDMLENQLKSRTRLSSSSYSVVHQPEQEQNIFLLPEFIHSDTYHVCTRDCYSARHMLQSIFKCDEDRKSVPLIQSMEVYERIYDSQSIWPVCVCACVYVSHVNGDLFCCYSNNT